MFLSSWRGWVACAASGLLTLVVVPSRARADEPTEAPANYRPERYPSAGTGSSLVLAGTGVALGGYALGFGTSYLWAEAPTASDLRIPVVGPALAIAGAGCSSAEVGCGTLQVAIRTVFATLSGLGQLGGLVIVAEGLLLPTAASAQSESLASDTQPAISHVTVAPEPQWFFSPVASDTGFGLSVAGEF
jgi:hypothetical protein